MTFFDKSMFHIINLVRNKGMENIDLTSKNITIKDSMLFDKIEKSCWTALTTFLVYLNRMPETIPGHTTKLCDIELDEHIIKTLRTI